MLDDRVLGLLRVHGKALCFAETDEAATPWLPTADFGYLRLRRSDYSPADLATTASRILAQPWREAFAFFKHEDEARGPPFAMGLRDALHEAAAAPTMR